VLSTEKLKCPRCGRLVLKKIVKATNGKCNNCGYFLASSITDFVAQKVPIQK
jgi:uncharacterized Zn finger protein